MTQKAKRTQTCQHDVRHHVDFLRPYATVRIHGVYGFVSIKRLNAPSSTPRSKAAAITTASGRALARRSLAQTFPLSLRPHFAAIGLFPIAAAAFVWHIALNFAFFANKRAIEPNAISTDARPKCRV